MKNLEDETLSETCNLLIELIQNKCINPPGNEMKSIKSIEKHLKKNGINCQIFESAPNRGNLIAKIQGTESQHPGLIFGPSHVDVVPVTKPDEWKVDPFAGTIKDGYIWGRGTIDMLFMVVTQIQAFVKLNKEKFKPKGDLILFIVADEECGGYYGAKWVIEKYPQELNIDKKKMFAVTESGGIAIAENKFIFINGEKGASWKILKFQGTPGHGSMPYGTDNAVLKSAEAAMLLTEYCDKRIPLETKYLKNLIKGMKMNFIIRGLLTNKIFLPLILKILRKRDVEMAKFIHSLSRMTISPNIIKGGTKTNIIASSSELRLDIRTLPDQDEEYVSFHIKKALGDLADEVEIISDLEEGITSIGTESPASSEFVNAMERAIQKSMPNASLIPLIAMGATDGRYMREKNIDTYGFALYDPDIPMNQFVQLAHGVNERVNIKTIELSLNTYYNLAKEFLS